MICRAAFTALTASLALALAGTAGAATITPNVVTDDFDAMMPDANCSLREAVQSSRTNAPFGGCPTGDAGLDTIVLTQPSATPYTLTIGSNDEEANAEGDLDYGSGGPLAIVGQNAIPGQSLTRSRIATLSPDRVFDVKGGANLTMTGVVLDDGDVTSVLADTDARGGNLRATGTNSVTLNNVRVTAGEAREGGGGAYVSTGTSLEVNDSTFFNNTDQNTGGGLFVQGAASAIIRRTVFEDNTLDTALVGNIHGAGLRATVDDGATLEVADSYFVSNEITHTGNQPADQAKGAGASISSQGTIRRTTFRSNVLASNVLERGGGLYMDGGEAGETLTVVNSTFFENTAGDADNDGQGGAVHHESNTSLVLSHVTFSANDATEAAAANHVHRGALGTGTVTLRGSILTGGLLGANACEGAAGTIISGGYNVSGASDSECGFGPTDFQGNGFEGPGLVAGGPVDNGGATRTIALQPGGRSVDFVPAAQCLAEGTDQRGYPRPLPLGGACDAGAYELHSCDGGTTVLNGPYVACPVPLVATPPGGTTTPVPAKKCKKVKKKKAGAAAKKKRKGCKKKKRRKK